MLFKITQKYTVIPKILHKTKVRNNEKENSRIIHKNVQNEAGRVFYREGAKAL